MKMALEPGQRVLACYDPDPSALWHERLLCGRVSEHQWIVCTPDRDIYSENVRSDYDRYVTIGPRGGLPRGFRQPVYRFEDGQGPLSPGEIESLLSEGAVLARAERGDDEELDPGDVGADERGWIFVESRGRMHSGEIVRDVAGLVARGDRGLLPLPGGE